MRKQANPLKYINPFYTLTREDPTVGDMIKNVLGVSAVTLPATVAITLLANRRRMRDMKKAIAKNAETNVNGSMPVLQLDDVRDNIAERNERELSQIRTAMNKNASDSGMLARWGKEILLGSIPAITPAIALWLAAKGTNEELKDRYSAQLDSENRAIQDMQDKLDMDTLVRMGYLKKTQPKTLNSTKNLSKTASVDFLGNLASWATTKASDATESGKKVLVTLPGAALVMAALGLGGWGTYHYLKNSDEVQKLKLLEKRMLGKDQILQSPEVLVDVPEGYEEVGKKTAQMLPGISPALIPSNVIEDAQLVEKPKKDAFLG